MKHPALEQENGTGEVARLVMFAVAVLCVVLGYRLHPGSALWLPVALAGVALAVWHGAYDSVLAERVLQPRFPGRWRVPFFAAYLLLATAVVLLWHWMPVVALAAFLLYSAVHFGTEAEHGWSPHSLAGAALGAVPLAAACRWWPHDVTAIFTVMLHGAATQAARVASVGAAVLVPALAFAVLCSWPRRRLMYMRLALIGLELLLFRFCPPVTAFAVFFCLWHTPEHLVETSRDSRDRFQLHIVRKNLRRGIGPWLLSLVAIAVAALFARPAMLAYTGLVFIALSALTVPHMVLALLPVYIDHAPQRSTQV